MEEKMEYKINNIKAVPELSAACLKNGKSQELAMWYLLQVLVQELGGGPDVIYSSLFDFFKSVKWSHSEVLRTLTSGDKIFWDCRERKNGTKEVLIYGRSKVVLSLVNERISDFIATIPLYKLKPGRKLRAWLYASAMSKFDGKPIARETIESYTGISPRLQVYYEKETGLIVKETNSKWKDGDGNIRQLPNSYKYPLPTSKMRVLRDIIGLYKLSVKGTGSTVYAAKKYFTKGIVELIAYLKKHPRGNWPIVYVATGKENTVVKSLQTWNKYRGRIYYEPVLLKDACLW